MIRNFRIWIAVCLMGTSALTACRKELEDPAAAQFSSLSVGMESCKTFMGGKQEDGKRILYWSEGDAICANGIASEALGSESAGSRTATFTFAEPVSFPAGIVYPASAHTDAAHITLPAVQQAFDGDGFASGSAPMLAKASADGTAMHHICAGIKVRITRSASAQETHKLSYIEFKGNNGEQVRGLFSADFDNAAISSASAAAADRSVRVLCNATPGTQAVSAIVMVPAGSFSKGFTVTIVDELGHAMDKSSDKAITLAAGTIHAFPAIEFIPTRTIIDTEIASADDLIKFAKDYNSGEATVLNGARITADIVFNSAKSAEFAATGGIGNAEHPFEGVLDGDGHSITSWTSNSCPIVGVATAGSLIKGITLDSSCTLNVSASAGNFSGEVGFIASRTEGRIENCHNRAKFGTIAIAYTKGRLNFGGIVGRAEGAQIVKCSCTGSQFNAATVSCDTLCFGMIAGYAQGTSFENCSNTDAVSITVNNGTASTSPVCIGGIAGCISGSAEECSNSAALTLVPQTVLKDAALAGIAAATCGEFKGNDLGNSGRIYINASAGITGESSSSISSMSNGGVIAKAAHPLSLTLCTNSGEVNTTYLSGTKINGRACYAGGILGIATGKGIVLTSCTSTASTITSNYNNTHTTDGGTFTAGIAGLLTGTPDSPATISGCHYTKGTLQCLRGVEGGVVARSEFATISDCSFQTACGTPSSNIPRYQGGITGWSLNTTISECSIRERNLTNKTTAETIAGGICGYMEAGCRILDCNATDNKFTRNGTGGLTAGSVAGSSTSATNEISGCHYSSSYSLDSGKTYSEMTASQIVGEGSFTALRPNVATNENITVKGKVTDQGGAPLAGVIVTNGRDCIRTDSNGDYQFATCNRGDIHIISATNPEGYAAPVEKGLPKFSTLLSSVKSVDGVYTINFKFNKLSGSTDKCRIIFSADLQPRSSTAGYDNFAYHSLDNCEDIYRDWREYSATVTDMPLYGITLGDIVHENMTLFTNYTNALAKNSFATYNVLGNHDYDLDSEGSTGGSYKIGALTFEKKLGPVNCSFTLGKWHVIVMNSMVLGTDGEGRHPKSDYAAGYDEETYTWLCNDLALVDKSTPIMLCMHAPTLKTHTSTYENTTARHLHDVAVLLSSFDKVHLWYGHWHNTYNYAYPSTSWLHNVEVHLVARSTGNLWTNEWTANGTPRGYVVASLNGSDISWKFRPVPYQSSEWATTAYKAPAYKYRPYTIDSSGTIKKNGKKLDDDFQMLLYPPSAYESSSVYATIFMWDNKWDTPIFTGDDGKSYIMERVTSTYCYDWSAKEDCDYYTANQPKLADQSYSYTNNMQNIFRAKVPSTVKGGTVKVTDRFGNIHTETINW